MKMRYWLYGALMVALVFVAGCTALNSGECNDNKDCDSGVCNHVKADLGMCEGASCTPGTTTDNNNFFCSEKGAWEPSKKEGEYCTSDYECYQPTCFMKPDCEITPIPRTRAACRYNACVYQVEDDSCAKEGLKRVLAKDQFTINLFGNCVESSEQAVLSSICAPCGNNVCDNETESECNCPEDCK
ncbi:hypothetical protein HY638_00530 [Candidatus Woesearchaeota archaeon]|nr:hypothetical protein [Candidatus Woesearchaeota archaeon]